MPRALFRENGSRDLVNGVRREGWEEVEAKVGRTGEGGGWVGERERSISRVPNEAVLRRYGEVSVSFLRTMDPSVNAGCCANLVDFDR